MKGTSCVWRTNNVREIEATMILFFISSLNERRWCCHMGYKVDCTRSAIYVFLFSLLSYRFLHSCVFAVECFRVYWHEHHKCVSLCVQCNIFVSFFIIWFLLRASFSVDSSDRRAALKSLQGYRFIYHQTFPFWFKICKVMKSLRGPCLDLSRTFVPFVSLT